MVSKGSKRFAELCKPHGRMGQVAKELGAQQSLVSRWAAGVRTPSAPWRIKLEQQYGIPLADWDEAPPAETGSAA